MKTQTENKDSYPYVPGYKARETSCEAAIVAAPTAATLRSRIMDLMRGINTPLSADEAADLLHESVLAIRPRVTELVALGFLRDSGTKCRNVSGRRAMRWEVVK